jgi:selenocysteine lyase/cysteine desulfurase
LNTSSLGPTSRAVHDAVVAAARQFELNPVAQGYWPGDTVSTAAAQARDRTAAFLGCTPDEVLFTRGGTDAMNTVAQGMVLGVGDRVLSTDQEHEGGSLCWQYLAKRRGVVIDTIAVSPDDDNASILRKLEAAVTPRTRVVSVSHVLFTTGRLMPVVDIAKMARAHQLTCVIDGAQALGALPVDVKQLGCHAYAASGHKWLRGPKGTGVLYVSADAGDAIRPIQWEESHDVVSGSSGLGPLPLMIGLAAAIEEASAHGLGEILRHNHELRGHALVRLRSVPKLRVISPSDSAMATSIVTCTLPDDVDGKALIRTLADQHHVQIKAIAHPINAIRLSPHTFNSVPDIDAAFRALSRELR